MSALREKIEALAPVCIWGGETPRTLIDRAEVLRIAAENQSSDHEIILKIAASHNGWANGSDFSSTAAVKALTAIGKALGDPFKIEPKPAWSCDHCAIMVHPGETFGDCPKCGKPMVSND